MFASQHVAFVIQSSRMKIKGFSHALNLKVKKVLGEISLTTSCTCSPLTCLFKKELKLKTDREIGNGVHRRDRRVNERHGCCI